MEQQTLPEVWIVTFAYSGCGKREFFTKEFECLERENITTRIKTYVHNQNVGETKSDRIRFWSKTKKHGNRTNTY